MPTCSVCREPINPPRGPCEQCAAALKPDYRGGPAPASVELVAGDVVDRLAERENPLWRAIVEQRGGPTILARAVALTLKLRPEATSDRTWWDAIDAQVFDECAHARAQ